MGKMLEHPTFILRWTCATEIELACPRESVATTCTVNGASLRWEAQEGDDEPVQIETFEQDSHDINNSNSAPECS